MCYIEETAYWQEQYQTIDLTNEHHPITRTFAFFSANIHQFMPQIPWRKHEELFRKMSLYQHLSHLDVERPDALNQLNLLGWNVSWVSQMKENPGLITCFHTGAYRLVNQLLAREGLRYVLLLSKQTIQREGKIFLEAYKKHAPKGSFLLLDAELSSSIFKIGHLLKAGYNILVYPDGNVGAASGTANLHKIPFLKHRLLVRTGVPFLAHLYKKPIYQLNSRRLDALTVKYDGFSCLLPEAPRQQFVRQSLKSLYRPLQQLLLHDAAQWTCWPQVHSHMADAKRLKTKLENPAYWAIFKQSNQFFLFDKRRYLSYPIDQKELGQYKDMLRMGQ
jgi:hypothetical protein